MRKMVTILALVLAVPFLAPAVSLAGGCDHHNDDYRYRNGPIPSLFIDAAAVVGAVIAVFRNAPAYWSDPHLNNPRTSYSNYEREDWGEDSRGIRYWNRSGGSYRSYDD